MIRILRDSYGWYAAVLLDGSKAIRRASMALTLSAAVHKFRHQRETERTVWEAFGEPAAA